MVPKEIGNDHRVLQKDGLNPHCGSGAEPRDFLDLFIPVFPFLHGNLSKLRSLHSPHLNSLWVHFKILRTHWNTSHRKCRSHLQCRRHRITTANRTPNLSQWITRCRPSTRRRRSGTWPVAAYTLVPWTSKLGCANEKGRGLLVFFCIHACFENITCLADYMIIILKGCQGASGIIIIWFAGFRAHGNTLVLGCFL